MENTTIAYKFVNHDVSALETLKDSFPYRMKVKLMKGEELTREEKNMLANKLAVSGKHSLKLMGWCFSFYDLLNEYWVEFTYGSIQRYYAPDKTSLSNCLSDISRIQLVTTSEPLYV